MTIEDRVAVGLYVIDIGRIAGDERIACITVLLVGNEAERIDEKYNVKQTQVW